MAKREFNAEDIQECILLSATTNDFKNKDIEKVLEEIKTLDFENLEEHEKYEAIWSSGWYIEDNATFNDVVFRYEDKFYRIFDEDLGEEYGSAYWEETITCDEVKPIQKIVYEWVEK